MTQAQKRLFAGLKNTGQRAEFVQMIRDQQSMMGGYDNWEAAYAGKVKRYPHGESLPASDTGRAARPEPEKG